MCTEHFGLYSFAVKETHTQQGFVWGVLGIGLLISFYYSVVVVVVIVIIIVVVVTVIIITVFFY